ncbi:proteasome assembly chaperone family protein [Halorubrum sp. DTA98]|uniref:proteasome assembly chaperone family protein n=1 Tax=Halorubrum sp. DTA98 TaxID=3402163 RepID=UPI003AAE0170
MDTEFSLDITIDEKPESSVIAAFPGPGMAGISANQYLIEQLDLHETGHIHADGLPTVTPFYEGRPYHHTRLFSKPKANYTFLTCELPIPAQLSEPFGRTLLDWIDESTVDEVTLLTTIPSLELFEELWYIASDDYYQHRLTDIEIAALQGGFLSGVNSSIINRAIDTNLRAGVIATSVNPRQPLDGGAALRLVEGLARIYGFDIETDQLRQFADRTRQHYEQLAAHVESQQRAEERTGRTEDYGFM